VLVSQPIGVGQGQKLNGDAMTFAAVRHQVDVETLRSEKTSLSDRCHQQNQDNQQLHTIVCVQPELIFFILQSYSMSVANLLDYYCIS